MKFRLVGFLAAGLTLSALAHSQYLGANGMNYRSMYSANMSQSFERMRLASQWQSKFDSLIARKTKTSTPAPTKPAMVDLDTGKYKPNGKRVTLETFLDAAGVEKENRGKVKQGLIQMFDGLESAMDEQKMKNDVFGSMSFFVCVNYAFATKKSLPANALPVVYNQLRTLLGSKEMKSLSGLEKQTYSETLLLLTALPMVIAVASETDAAQAKTLEEVAQKNLQNILNVDPSKLHIDEKGLSILP